ncbi:2Fe-2S iron-sulfur cluster-binding protein [Streptomyces varsoviensis]|uniref:2Fe-2S iron-sulfur cluster-binding protein n=1 Tax=Streptomyces varsoviensis TaxID=67373 RepID=UPI0005600348|nr:2Fe-2S iron-sulfur cluster-binding protein [Streptomyces varsoviensis]
MAGARHGAFHPLRVAAVDRLTDDAVALTLTVPGELRTTFRYAPGQHVAVRLFVDDTEVRRTYSICAPVTDPDGPRSLRVGVRRVEGGEFSTYALKELSVGDTVDVMAPAGRFVLEPRAGRFAAVVGGSGITPVLSIAATLLARRTDASFCLIRSDRTAASTMFLEEVADLKDRYPDRFHLVHALSREEQQAGLASGRLDEERLSSLLPALLPVAEVDGWFLCGPYGLVRSAERALRGLGVDRRRVHQEIFHVDDGTAATPLEATATTAGPTAGTGTGTATAVGIGATATGTGRGATAAGATAAGPAAAAQASAGPAAARSSVTAKLDGRSGDWPVLEGESLLDAVLRNRADAPYACKGGVCGTCRAFLVSGEVRMDRNFALEPEEVESGYVLACQSHPVTERVELDFDR